MFLSLQRFILSEKKESINLFRINKYYKYLSKNTMTEWSGIINEKEVIK